MSNSCVYKPSLGKKLHEELTDKLDHKLATDVFLLSINPEFKEQYKDTLRLDSEGVPSYESLMKVPYVEKFIGKEGLRNSLESKFSTVLNEPTAYSGELQKAYEFNTKEANKDKFVAIVKDNDDGKSIKISLVDKTTESIKAFNDQYSADAINKDVGATLDRENITSGILAKFETNLDERHPTLNKAKMFATDLNSVIQSAVNKNIDTTISKDVAKLLIDKYKEHPLIIRSLNYIKDNISPTEQEDSEEAIDAESTDEEANDILADIVANNIAKNEIDETLEGTELFQNTLNYIKENFNKPKYLDVANALINGDNTIDSIAKEMLNNIADDNKSETYDLENSKAIDKVAELKNRTKRVRDILKEALKIEAKKSKIMSGAAGTDASNKTLELVGYLDKDADVIEGIYSYGYDALKNLESLLGYVKSLNSNITEDTFHALRGYRTALQSYGSFIDKLSRTLISEEDKEDNLLSKHITIHDTDISAEPLIKELKSLIDEIATRYSEKALPAFAQFLKPFMGDDIVVAFGKDKGKRITIESLLASADKDISILDRWLDSMTDSSDTMLQLFGKVVHKANDNARLRTIDSYGEITKLRLETEKKGLTNYDWMFEKYSDGSKTGNYISEVNVAQFEKDLKELNDSLDEKYGKNPSGTELANKIAERKEWAKVHSASEGLYFQPNVIYYENADFKNLDKDKRDLYDNFKFIKAKYDSLLPENPKLATRAIQQRKSGSQRLLDSSTSFGSLFSNALLAASLRLLNKAPNEVELSNSLCEPLFLC